jgi:hypothetical protein
MWEVGSLLRSTDAGAPATREVAEAASRALPRRCRSRQSGQWVVVVGETTLSSILLCQRSVS